ncbi:MAG: spore germination protein [Clostridiales bacterium]|nr:spore germination protein [Clostridiales bacterium]
MKKRKVLLFFLVITILFLSGCWSKREINELAIVSVLGIDKSKGGYLVSVQIINPSEVAAQEKTTRAPVTTYGIEGKTIFEALRKLTLKSPRKLYFAHLRMVVFGEDLAREGIGKTLDFLSRDHEFRTNFYMLVAKNNKAEKVLNILTPMEEIPGNKMYAALETSEKVWAPTHTTQLDELINNMVAEGRNPVLTGVILKGNPKTGMDIRNVEKVDVPTVIQIGYIAAFKKDKLAGWLNETESRGYNSVMGYVKSSVVTIPCEKGGNVAIEILKTRAKVKGKVKDGKPWIDIDYKVEGNVGDVECNIDLIKIETIDKIEKALEKEIKGYITAAVKKAQKDLKSDIFGFGEKIHKADPEAWKVLKQNWNEEFVDLPVDIKVTAKIKGLGTITESFQEKAKE